MNLGIACCEAYAHEVHHHSDALACPVRGGFGGRMSKICGLALLCLLVAVPVSADGWLPTPTVLVEWVMGWFGEMGPAAEPGGIQAPEPNLGPAADPHGFQGPSANLVPAPDPHGLQDPSENMGPLADPSGIQALEPNLGPLPDPNG